MEQTQCAVEVVQCAKCKTVFGHAFIRDSGEVEVEGQQVAGEVIEVGDYCKVVLSSQIYEDGGREVRQAFCAVCEAPLGVIDQVTEVLEVKRADVLRYVVPNLMPARRPARVKLDRDGFVQEDDMFSRAVKEAMQDDMSKVKYTVVTLNKRMNKLLSSLAHDDVVAAPLPTANTETPRIEAEVSPSQKRDDKKRRKSGKNKKRETKEKRRRSRSVSSEDSLLSLASGFVARSSRRQHSNEEVPSPSVVSISS